ncbi:cytochrome b [Motiliproteus coralliicola]|uniref:Cytochrome b n=1 Tax=Motiliproteus coralliicola TaxID=2283196 RepID=A0A369WU64_9GAMM|nr:cytochrome b [Motiliproteus coralliicola]RDE24673.1 cytochrome b [Motiliproteus coralliicola]
MNNDTLSRLSKTTIRLHWVIAFLMIMLLASGIYMASTETFALYSWHKSFGILVFGIAVIRIAWRIKQGWPKHVGDYSLIERALSKATHWILILGTVAMPISGIVMNAMGGYGVEAFGVELFPTNTGPEGPFDFVAINEPVADFAHAVHSLAGDVLVIAVALHILGALKHHLLDRDATIRRMLGSSTQG